jgi:hypothetical protein
MLQTRTNYCFASLFGKGLGSDALSRRKIIAIEKTCCAEDGGRSVRDAGLDLLPKKKKKKEEEEEEERGYIEEGDE